MRVEVVAHGSPKYLETIQLRREILRRPLGLDFMPQQLADEATDIHLAGIVEGQVVACLILTPVGNESAHMRQVAVVPERQRQGLGRLIVEASEGVARNKGFHKMILHARDTAVPFYLALGYTITGEPFEEVSIPHLQMFKIL